MAGLDLPSVIDARNATAAWLVSDDLTGESVDPERLDLMIALHLRDE